MSKKTVLIIGATGMLGNALMTELSRYKNLETFGSVRYPGDAQKYLPEKIIKKIISDINVENTDNLVSLLGNVKPDVVINCVGYLSHKNDNDIISGILLNSALPHRLAKLCKIFNARLIHISTDGIFSGKKGNYQETDIPDASDFYGRTKFLGEVGAHHLTIRTSIIGHGLENHASLIDWFLGQKGKIKGYCKNIYSGLPTVELARIIAEFIIPNTKLEGIYHLSSAPISKYELLSKVAKIYHKKIQIIADDKKVSDHSLDSTRFRKMTSYQPPSWEKLIKNMYRYYRSNPNFVKFQGS